LYANPAMVFSAIEPEDRSAVEASWHSPAPPPLTVRWQRPGGGITWTEQRAVGVCDDSGQVIATEGILLRRPPVASCGQIGFLEGLAAG
jgi:PAS fold